MSVQINQYLMYAVSIPPKAFEERGEDWYDQMSEKFQDDSAYKKEVKHVDGIFWLYDGMSGKYSLIGRVMDKSSDGDFIASNGPMTMPELSGLEKEFIHNSVKRNFEIEGEFKMYLVTHYR
jgi:hypothetical protein